jgi:tRNA (cytidine32/uridine32-2'-O)-methyltransferase
LSLERVRIVLIATTHPGNIGATARAMLNMRLNNLVLVQPKLFPHEAATARASGADSVLEKARVVATLDEAVAGCQLVIGTGMHQRTVAWPLLSPRAAAEKIAAHYDSTDVAIVFGREHSGMSNDELDLCHYLVTIPANPDFGSLNLAMAVQLLAYEILLASQERPELMTPLSLPASAEKFSAFMAHLAQTLDDIGFTDPRKSDKMLRRLRRLFMRAAPEDEELNLLRGILSAAQGRKSMRRSDLDE